jgi:hypothetical protein
MVALALAMSAHGGVAVAATPRDGGWRALGSNWVTFTVQDGGATIATTNSLLFGAGDCGWGGPLSPGPIPVGADGSFTASNAGGMGSGGGGSQGIDVAGQFTSPTTVHLTVTLSQCVTGGPPSVLELDGGLVDPPSSTTQHCAGLQVRAGRSRVVPTARVRAHPRRYRRGTAFATTVRGGTCADLRRILARVLQAKDETLGIGGEGLAVVRVRRKRVRGVPAYGVGAVAGGLLVGYTRVGNGLRVDHSLYRAGQAIIVAASATPGARGSKCTGGFVLALASRPRPVALTAGHCAETDSMGQPHPVFREIDRRGPLPFGAEVDRELLVDAMVFGIDPGYRVLQQIERGELPPLTADGVVPDAEQTPGKAVCFAGRNSGADRCGKIVPRYRGAPTTYGCTNISATHGDSGGPVYEDTGTLATRAVGIAVEIRGRHHRMCYESMDTMLHLFGATLAPPLEVANGPS